MATVSSGAKLEIAFPSEGPAESRSCLCTIPLGAPGKMLRNCLGLAHVITPHSSVPLKEFLFQKLSQDAYPSFLSP